MRDKFIFSTFGPDVENLSKIYYEQENLFCNYEIYDPLIGGFAKTKETILEISVLFFCLSVILTYFDFFLLVGAEWISN